MSKSKFWLYFILTSFIWGGCLYLTTFSFKEPWYAISFMFFVFLTEFIREIIFKTEEEKEQEQKKYNQPITFKLALKGLFYIVLIIGFIVLFLNFYKSFSNTMLINIMYFVIGGIWLSSNYRAWSKT